MTKYYDDDGNLFFTGTEQELALAYAGLSCHHANDTVREACATLKAPLDCDLDELEEASAKRYAALDVLLADHARLAAIVARLPKCWRLVGGELRQDEPIDLMEDAWLTDPSPHCVQLVTMDRMGIITTMFHGTPYRHVAPSDLYATREAAEHAIAARRKG
jgi:hypothetical protein